MAPPKVDLSNKGKSPELIPEAIVIDQSSEFAKLSAQRQLNRKRKRCRAAICVLIIGIVVVAVALPLMVYMHRRHHRSNFTRWCGTDDHRIPEHVRIDYSKQLIFVNNTKSGEFGTTHALHDYQKKISVFRDPQHQRCFVEPLEKSFEEGLDAWDTDRDRDDWHDDKDRDEHHHKHHNDDDDDDKKEMHGHHGMKPKLFYKTNEEVKPATARQLWGNNVADHCRGHKFHMMKPIPRPSTKPPMTHLTIVIKIASVDAIRIIFVHINRV